MAVLLKHLKIRSESERLQGQDTQEGTLYHRFITTCTVAEFKSFKNLEWLHLSNNSDETVFMRLVNNDKHAHDILKYVLITEDPRTVHTLMTTQSISAYTFVSYVCRAKKYNLWDLIFKWRPYYLSDHGGFKIAIDNNDYALVDRYLTLFPILVTELSITKNGVTNYGLMRHAFDKLNVLINSKYRNSEFKDRVLNLKNIKSTDPVYYNYLLTTYPILHIVSAMWRIFILQKKKLSRYLGKCVSFTTGKMSKERSFLNSINSGEKFTDNEYFNGTIFDIRDDECINLKYVMLNYIFEGMFLDMLDICSHPYTKNPNHMSDDICPVVTRMATNMIHPSKCSNMFDESRLLKSPLYAALWTDKPDNVIIQLLNTGADYNLNLQIDIISPDRSLSPITLSASDYLSPPLKVKLRPNDSSVVLLRHRDGPFALTRYLANFYNSGDMPIDKNAGFDMIHYGAIDDYATIIGYVNFGRKQNVIETILAATIMFNNDILFDYILGIHPHLKHARVNMRTPDYINEDYGAGENITNAISIYSDLYATKPHSYSLLEVAIYFWRESMTRKILSGTDIISIDATVVIDSLNINLVKLLDSHIKYTYAHLIHALTIFEQTLTKKYDKHYDYPGNPMYGILSIIWHILTKVDISKMVIQKSHPMVDKLMLTNTSQYKLIWSIIFNQHCDVVNRQIQHTNKNIINCVWYSVISNNRLQHAKVKNLFRVDGNMFYLSDSMNEPYYAALRHATVQMYQYIIPTSEQFKETIKLLLDYNKSDILAFILNNTSYIKNLVDINLEKLLNGYKDILRQQEDIFVKSVHDINNTIEEEKKYILTDEYYDAVSMYTKITGKNPNTENIFDAIHGRMTTQEKIRILKYVISVVQESTDKDLIDKFNAIAIEYDDIDIFTLFEQTADYISMSDKIDILEHSNRDKAHLQQAILNRLKSRFNNSALFLTNTYKTRDIETPNVRDVNKPNYVNTAMESVVQADAIADTIRLLEHTIQPVSVIPPVPSVPTLDQLRLLRVIKHNYENKEYIETNITKKDDPLPKRKKKQSGSTIKNKKRQIIQPDEEEEEDLPDIQPDEEEEEDLPDIQPDEEEEEDLPDIQPDEEEDLPDIQPDDEEEDLPDIQSDEDDVNYAPPSPRNPKRRQQVNLTEVAEKRRREEIIHPAKRRYTGRKKVSRPLPDIIEYTPRRTFVDEEIYNRKTERDHATGEFFDRSNESLDDDPGIYYTKNGKGRKFKSGGRPGVYEYGQMIKHLSDNAVHGMMSNSVSMNVTAIKYNVKLNKKSAVDEVTVYDELRNNLYYDSYNLMVDRTEFKSVDQYISNEYFDDHILPRVFLLKDVNITRALIKGLIPLGLFKRDISTLLSSASLFGSDVFIQSFIEYMSDLDPDYNNKETCKMYIAHALTVALYQCNTNVITYFNSRYTADYIQHCITSYSTFNKTKFKHIRNIIRNDSVDILKALFNWKVIENDDIYKERVYVDKNRLAVENCGDCIQFHTVHVCDHCESMHKKHVCNRHLNEYGPKEPDTCKECKKLYKNALKRMLLCSQHGFWPNDDCTECSNKIYKMCHKHPKVFTGPMFKTMQDSSCVQCLQLIELKPQYQCVTCKRRNQFSFDESICPGCRKNGKCTFHKNISDCRDCLSKRDSSAEVCRDCNSVRNQKCNVTIRKNYAGMAIHRSKCNICKFKSICNCDNLRSKEITSCELCESTHQEHINMALNGYQETAFNMAFLYHSVEIIEMLLIRLTSIQDSGHIDSFGEYDIDEVNEYSSPVHSRRRTELLHRSLYFLFYIQTHGLRLDDRIHIQCTQYEIEHWPQIENISGVDETISQLLNHDTILLTNIKRERANDKQANMRKSIEIYYRLKPDKTCKILEFLKTYIAIEHWYKITPLENNPNFSSIRTYETDNNYNHMHSGYNALMLSIGASNKTAIEWIVSNNIITNGGDFDLITPINYAVWLWAVRNSPFRKLIVDYILTQNYSILDTPGRKPDSQSNSNIVYLDPLLIGVVSQRYDIVTYLMDNSKTRRLLHPSVIENVYGIRWNVFHAAILTMNYFISRGQLYYPYFKDGCHVDGIVVLLANYLTDKNYSLNFTYAPCVNTKEPIFPMTNSQKWVYMTVNELSAYSMPPLTYIPWIENNINIIVPKFILRPRFNELTEHTFNTIKEKMNSVVEKSNLHTITSQVLNAVARKEFTKYRHLIGRIPNTLDIPAITTTSELIKYKEILTTRFTDMLKELPQSAMTKEEKMFISSFEYAPFDTFYDRYNHSINILRRIDPSINILPDFGFINTIYNTHPTIAYEKLIYPSNDTILKLMKSSGDTDVNWDIFNIRNSIQFNIDYDTVNDNLLQLDIIKTIVYAKQWSEEYKYYYVEVIMALLEIMSEDVARQLKSVKLCKVENNDIVYETILAKCPSGGLVDVLFEWKNHRFRNSPVDTVVTFRNINTTKLQDYFHYHHLCTNYTTVCTLDLNISYRKPYYTPDGRIEEQYLFL